MTAKDERARGVEILTEILSGGRILRVKEPRAFHNGYSYYFEVTAYDKVTDFCLSAEVLEDMEGTPGYKQHANKFARAIEKRLRNPRPQAFMTRSGVPIEVESFWPHEAWAGRAASLVRTNVRDLRDSRLAKCFVVVTHQQQIFDLKENPFIEFGGIINGVRDAVDAGDLVFHPDADHPDTLQRVDLRLGEYQRQGPKTLETFLETKVFWLGFKADNAGSLVWIADPWDADYLGISAPELVREPKFSKRMALFVSRRVGSSGQRDSNFFCAHVNWKLGAPPRGAIRATRVTSQPANGMFSFLMRARIKRVSSILWLRSLPALDCGSGRTSSR